MWLLIEIVLLLAKIILYWILSIFKSFVPTSLIAKTVQGKTVLITGAGGGIGRLLAEKFAGKGCRLVLWDVNKRLNQQTLDIVKSKFGAEAVVYTVDLSVKDEIYTTAQKVIDEFGNVDILVNNAGVVFGKNVIDARDDQMVKTMEVNCFAHYWACKAFLPHMIEKNDGHLVTVASSAGLIGVPGMADYCSSKFAAVGFEESLRLELAQTGADGIKTTVVCPFLIGTNMFDGCKMRFPSITRALDPDYVATSILNAVLRDDDVLFLPRFIYISFFLKTILPVKCLDLIYTFLGTTTLMRTFVGGHKKDG